MKILMYFFLMAHTVVAQLPVSAQQNEVVERQSYYVNINQTSPHRIIEVADNTLSLEYNDKYGAWSHIQLHIVDWKLKQVATVSLDKQFGLNHYNLDLSSIYSGWERGKLYRLDMKDETGRKHTLSIRPIEPPDKEAPIVDIIVNPVQLQCDGMSPSVVEFVGSIGGGKAPYTLQWVVIDKYKTKLLYQPEEVFIMPSGTTAAISVDRSPDYYVLLEVKDACGNIERKQVFLQCDDKTQKINTMFVEPMTLQSTETN